MKLLYIIFHSLPWITPIVWLYVIGGSYKVLKLNRSKNGYKKLKKSLTFRDKLLKKRFVQLSISAKGYQKYFCFMTYLGYILIAILIILWFLSIFTGDFKTMFKWYMYVKCYILEFPAFVFTVCNIGRPQSRIGLDWKFVRK